MEFSSECHRFHTGKLLSASYSAISGTKTFWWNHSKRITRLKYGLHGSSYHHWALCVCGSLWQRVISAKSLLLYCLDWKCVTQKLVIKWKPLNFCRCHTVMPLREMERLHKCTTVKDEKSLRFIYGSEGQRLCEYALNGLTERDNLHVTFFWKKKWGCGKS